MKLKRFVTSLGTYTFSDTQNSFSDNFGDLVPQTRRLPGNDGGFDVYGADRAPSEIGTIRTTLWLIPGAGQTVTGLKDDVDRMATWGEGRLYAQPYDSTLPERWVFCKINNIQASENVSARPDERQQVTIIWQATDPFWYGQGTESPVWGGLNWGEGQWDGGGEANTVNSSLSQFTVTNNGSGVTYPRIIVDVGTDGANDITVQRIVDGVARDEVAWLTVNLVDGDTWAVDARALTVTYNGTATFTSGFSYSHPNFFRLFPGDNTIKVTMTNEGDATITMYWYETYYSV